MGKLPKIAYSAEEEDWLVTNALLYRTVIENKKTDGATKRDKDIAREKIQRAFNVAPPGQQRTTKSLREKYGKIKQHLKNRVFYHAHDANQTGGGPPKKELPPLSEPMLELFSILMPSTYGLLPTFGDSDDKPSAITYCAVDVEIDSEEYFREDFIESDDDKVIVEVDSLDLKEQPAATQNITEHSGTVNLDKLKKKINPLLKTKHRQEMEEDFMESDDNVNVEVDLLDLEEQPATTQISSEHSWGRVNPAKLKKTINPLLKTKRRQKMEAESHCKEKQQHLTKKHGLEIQILECEEERYRLERRRASLDAKRASIECERAKIDQERSVIELQIVKNRLALEMDGAST